MKTRKGLNMKMNVFVKLWSILFILSIVSTSAAKEWNQFRGPMRDGRSTEKGLLETWPEDGPPMLWSYQGLGRGYATVSVVDGVLYTTGMIDETGFLFAIRDSGELKWRHPYGPEWTGSYPGTRTTPTVDGDRLYVMSGQGRIACFNRESGDRIWSIDTLEKFQGENITWGIAESVLIDGDKVICTPGGENASIVALNKYTGETIWTSKGLSKPAAYCSPILVSSGSNRLLFTMVKDLFVCLNVDNGDVLWTIPHPTRNHIAAITPVVCKDNRVYFTSHGTGGTMIQFKENGAAFSELWTSNALACLHGGVVVYENGAGQCLYGSDERGNWVCQDVQTGKVIFEEKILNAKGSITYADDRFYCYSEKGMLGLVKPTEKDLELVSSFQIALGSNEHWAYPVIQDRRLYIRHGDTLMAFDIKKN